MGVGRDNEKRKRAGKSIIRSPQPPNSYTVKVAGKRPCGGERGPYDCRLFQAASIPF